MAAGFWAKFKKLGSDVWKNVAKGITWANDNVIKPIVIPTMKEVAPFFGPKGEIINQIVKQGSSIIDTALKEKGESRFSDAVQRMRNNDLLMLPVDNILNRKIKLKM